MELFIAVLAGIAFSAFAGFVLLRLWRGRRSGISIRMQVFVSMAAVSGVFAAMLGLIAVQRLESRSALLSEQVAREDATLVARLLSASDRPLAETAAALRARRVFASGASSSNEHDDGLRVQIYDAAGRLVYESRDSHDPGDPARRLPVGAEQRAPILGPTLIAGLGSPRILGEVRVLRPTLGWRQILRDVASRAAVLSLLLVIGTASASALIGRAIAKPIERLTGAASRIAHGERQAVLPRPVGREVRTLTAAVESMRRELEGRHLAERLATDLSHQLKNPVAAIRASAEVLADGALDEPETARRFVGRILEATERVLGLVNNLLALTRLQARGVESELLDVGHLAHLSADAHLAQAERHKVRIQVQAAPGAVVRGDAAWLRRAIDNLIDNALCFTPPDSPPISVRVRVADTQVFVEVANPGPGVAQEVRGRLFERFVTTRRDTGGSGLGLAIVAAVAEQHGGNIEVAAPGPPRTEFRLTLPRASAALHQIFP